jgi:transposase-like protein
VEEAYVKVAGRGGYVSRALAESGRVVAGLFREHRDPAATTAFLRAALANTGVRPQTVTPDPAAAYPPALAARRPALEPSTGKAEQPSSERDHQQRTGRRRVLRGGQTASGTPRFWPAHGFVRNRRPGVFRLGAVPQKAKPALRPPLVRAGEVLPAP